MRKKTLTIGGKTRAGLFFRIIPLLRLGDSNMALIDHWKDTLINDMRELIAGLLTPTSLVLFGLTSKTNYAWVLRHEQEDWTKVKTRKTSTPLYNMRKDRVSFVHCARLGTLALVRDGNDALVSNVAMAQMSPRTILAFSFSVRILPRFLALNGNYVDPANTKRSDPINDAFIADWLTPDLLGIMCQERGVLAILKHPTKRMNVLWDMLYVDNADGIRALLPRHADPAFDLDKLKQFALNMGAMECLKELHKRHPSFHTIRFSNVHIADPEILVFLDANGFQFKPDDVADMVHKGDIDCVRFLLTKVTLTNDELVTSLIHVSKTHSDGMLELLLSKASVPFSSQQVLKLLSYARCFYVGSLLHLLLVTGQFAAVNILILVDFLHSLVSKPRFHSFLGEFVDYIKTRQDALPTCVSLDHEAYMLVNYAQLGTMAIPTARKVLLLYMSLDPQIGTLYVHKLAKKQAQEEEEAERKKGYIHYHG